MGLATFSTSYTVTRLITGLAEMPHIGTIFLVFISSAFAFYSKQLLGKLIATIYLLILVLVSFFIDLYYKLGVTAYSLPWPYSNKNDIDRDNLLLQPSYQIAEVSFILLCLLSVLAVHCYIKKIKSARKKSLNAKSCNKLT